MKNNFKSKLSIICVVCLLVCLISGMAVANAASEEEAPAADMQYEKIPMYVNGIKVTDGYKVGETTYAPLRAFVEFMDEQSDIAWDEESQTVTVSNEDLELSAALGKKIHNRK